MTSSRSARANTRPIPRDRPDQQATGPDQLDIETMVASSHGRPDKRRPLRNPVEKDSS